MSATAFQRKRRELAEQTSAAARTNESGGDDKEKTEENYDFEGDTGAEHQAGNPPPTSEQETPEREAEEVGATAGARELAESEGVNLADVEGSGESGRVTKGDVEKHLSD